MLRNLLKNNGIFLLPSLILFVFLSIILVTCSKYEIYLWINGFHSLFFDWFFRNITNLGDGLFVIIPVVLLLFFSLRPAVYIMVSYLSTGLIAQLIKRLLFADAARPVRFYSDNPALRLVDGVVMLSNHSFPSGHATTAFAIFICLSLLSDNRWAKLAFFLVACLVAFSRIYLSQHFLIDVFAGSIIGFAGAIALYPLFYGKNRPWHGYTIQKMFRHA
jgi:membrane-associated phospholipid phosphatase